jgi:hypothetical protein
MKLLYFGHNWFTCNILVICLKKFQFFVFFGAKQMEILHDKHTVFFNFATHYNLYQKILLEYYNTLY